MRTVGRAWPRSPAHRSRPCGRHPPDVPEPRGVVTGEDARDAVLLIAAAINSAVQSGQMPAGRGVYAMAMLMVVRDYLQPLPTVPGPDGADRITPDLAEMVKMLRQGGSEAGIQEGSRSPRSGPGSAPRCLFVTRPAATETPFRRVTARPPPVIRARPAHYRRPAPVLGRR
jgi:hypothetical protein